MTRPGWSDLGTTVREPTTAPLTSDTTVEIAVIGLGASGLEAVRHLADRGVDVLGIDAGAVGAGAAGRNGGFLLAGGARFHDVAARTWGPDLARLVYDASLDELDRVRERHPDLVRPTGSLRVAADDEERVAIAAQLERMRRDGFPVEPYDGPEGDGLLVPTDAHVQPLSRCRALAQQATDAGARLVTGTPVTEVGTGLVRTAVGPVVRAERTLVAVDGGLEVLLPELAGRVRTVRLQMLATAPTTEVSWGRPIYRRYGLDYVVQLPSGEVLLGGGRDVGGDPEWGAPAEPSLAVQAYLDGLLGDLGVSAAVTHRWAGRSAFTDDLLPLVSEVRPGVVAVGAYSGHGNLLGTRLARNAADALVDGRPVSLESCLQG